MFRELVKDDQQTPKNKAAAWYGLGLALLKLECLPEAQENLQKATTLDPESQQYKTTLEKYMAKITEQQRQKLSIQPD